MMPDGILIPMSCQPRRLSLKWWFVTARMAAHRKSVAATHTTCLVLTYVCATMSAKMMTTFKLMTISMTHCQMTVVMMKSELGPELYSTRYIRVIPPHPVVVVC